MLSFRNFGRKITFLGAGFFLFLNFAPVHADTNYGELLANENKGDMNKLIAETKKTLEKNPSDKEALKTIGVAYHNLAAAGEKSAAQQAVDYLEKANKLYPDDPFILVMLGSSTTLIGRYSKDIVTEGRKFSNKGAAMIDRAVAKAPDDVIVRMVRANNSRGLPSMFGRGHYFKDDMLHVEGIINKKPASFNPSFKALVYYKLATYFKFDASDQAAAKSYFKKAAEVSPDSEWGKKSKKEL